MAKKSTGTFLLVGPPGDTAWIRYLSGFEAPDPVYAVVRAGVIHLVVSPLEAGRAATSSGHARGVQVHTLASLGATQRGADLLTGVIRLLDQQRVNNVRVGKWFPVHAAQQLAEAGVQVSVDGQGGLQGREIKSAPEIAHIRHAQRAAVEAMRCGIDAIANARIDRHGYLRSGQGRLTSEAVRCLVEQVLLSRACRGEGVIIAGGRQAADPHERGHGPLRAREPIVLDIFPRHTPSGYWGDLTRTVIRGPAPDRVCAMYDAVARAQASALKSIKAGVAARTVHRAAADELIRRGFSTRLDAEPPAGFIHGTGHGLGLEIHEPPALRDGPGRLRAGHVVTVEPGLYYPSAGGIRIEDTVVVTKDGARLLATAPRVFCVDA